MSRLPISRSTESAEFVQLARAITLGRGRLGDTELHAAQSGFARVAEIAKAAASAGTTATLSNLLSYDNLQVGFVEGLRGFGAFDALYPFTARFPLLKPVAVTTTATVGGEVGEGVPTPITSMAVTGSGIAQRKAIATAIFSDEILRLTNQSLFANELRGSIAAATDVPFVADLATTSLSTAASGTTAAHFLADLAAAAVQMSVTSRSRLFLLADPMTVVRLALLPGTEGRAFPDVQTDGGEIGGIQIVPCDAIEHPTAGADLILADAAQLAANSLTIELSASRQASVQMDTAPDAPPDGNTVFTSLWQQGLYGLRATRFFGFRRLRDTAAAIISAADYGAATP